MEEKSTNTIGVPAEAKKFIERVARKCSWRRSIRKEVRRELTVHFEDALCDVDEAEKNGVAQGLIKDFGDPVLLAALIGRGKRRCLPRWERTLLATVKIAAVLLVVGIVVDLVLSRHSSEALQAEIARLRSTGAPTTFQDVIAQARQDDTAVALGREERLKRCPATARLYDLGRLEIKMDAEVHGMRVFETGHDPAIMEQLCSVWDAKTAADVNGLLSQYREDVQKIEALAALPMDAPADVVWFETQCAPDLHDTGRNGVPDSAAFRELNALAGPPELTHHLSASRLLALDAVRAFQEQGADAALDRATAIVSLSNHLANASHFIVGALVACAMRHMAITDIVQPLLNRADVSNPAAVRFQDCVARLDLAKELADSLAHERMYLLNSFEDAYIREQLFSAGEDPRSARPRGVIPDVLSVRARLLPFLHDNDAVVMLEFMNRLVEITALPHPEYLAKNGQWATDLAQVSPWRAPLALITVPDSSSYKTRVTETLTLQELTRVAFALRRFKTAKGAYPDALCALEPEFLPEAPVDQFTCKPLLYRKEGDGCVFYSVGKGQDDEGGTGDDCVWKLTR